MSDSNRVDLSVIWNRFLGGCAGFALCAALLLSSISLFLGVRNMDQNRQQDAGLQTIVQFLNGKIQQQNGNAQRPAQPANPPAGAPSSGGN